MVEEEEEVTAEDEGDESRNKTENVKNTKTHQLRPYERNTMCDNCDNDPVMLFFKSMAMTVKTFEPHLIVEAKSRIFQIVNEIELKSIQVKDELDRLFVRASTGDTTATITEDADANQQ